MTSREEIERLLNYTGRTLERLPEDYGDKKLELWNSFRDKTFGHIKSFDMANRILHQSDVIELLVAALRDALAERDAALAKVPRWISVKERLPEHEHEVLVYTDRYDGRTEFAYYVRHLEAWYQNCCLLIPNVTHWMSLPPAA